MSEVTGNGVPVSSAAARVLEARARQLRVIVAALSAEDVAGIVADAASTSGAKGAPEARAAAEAMHRSVMESSDLELVVGWASKLAELIEGNGYSSTAFAWLTEANDRCMVLAG